MHGVVEKYLRLGNNAAITVAVGGADRPPLFMSVPLHVAQERGIDAGTEMDVSLLAQGIHLMPPDSSEESAHAKHRRMQPASDLVA